MRRTKIVATIGPASDSPEVLAALVEAGMDVARLNMAHGSPDEHVARLRRVREAAGRAGRPVAVLADLPGPKIRTGELGGDPGVVLVEGAEVVLVAGADPGDAGRITVDHRDLPPEHGDLLADLEPGDRVALGDGDVVLQVERVEAAGVAGGGAGATGSPGVAGGTVVTAVVRSGGRLRGRPGVHLPTTRTRLASPTEHDLRLLEVACSAGADLVAVSFVRGPGDVRRVRDAAGPDGPMVVAKIETAAAVDALDAIIDVADAVMVARGDLGIALPLEEVPHVQKRIIRTCVAFGRPVITATQMLESMTSSPRPTRAEASDVANAVFDGTDALMLSGETAIGHDPALVVRTMAGIAERAERDADYVRWGQRLGRLQRVEEVPVPLAVTAAVSHAGWLAALTVDADAILCCTRSGATARAVARFRPTMRLLAFTPHPMIANQLCLTWGVEPHVLGEQPSTDDLVWFSVQHACEEGVVAAGDLVAVLAGSPDDPDSVTDTLRVVRVR